MESLGQTGMNWVPFATSFLGALFGALGAFLVGWLKERREEKKERHTALLATQYALHSQWSILQDIRKNLLNPVRHDPHRFTKLKLYFRNSGEQLVPFSKLTFILNSDNPNLLQEIHVAENKFLSAIRLLDQVNQLRSRLLADFGPVGFNAQTGAGEMVLPAHEGYALKNLTDLLYHSVDEALPAIEGTNNLVAGFTKNKLRKCKVLVFEYPDGR